MMYLHWFETDVDYDWVPVRYRAELLPNDRLRITMCEQGDPRRVGFVLDAADWQARVLGTWRYAGTPVSVTVNHADLAGIQARAPWLNATAHAQ